MLKLYLPDLSRLVGNSGSLSGVGISLSTVVPLHTRPDQVCQQQTQGGLRS